MRLLGPTGLKRQRVRSPLACKRRGGAGSRICLTRPDGANGVSLHVSGRFAGSNLQICTQPRGL